MRPRWLSSATTTSRPPVERSAIGGTIMFGRCAQAPSSCGTGRSLGSERIGSVRAIGRCYCEAAPVVSATHSRRQLLEHGRPVVLDGGDDSPFARERLDHPARLLG